MGSRGVRLPFPVVFQLCVWQSKVSKVRFSSASWSFSLGFLQLHVETDGRKPPTPPRQQRFSQRAGGHGPVSAGLVSSPGT